MKGTKVSVQASNRKLKGAGLGIYRVTDSAPKVTTGKFAKVTNKVTKKTATPPAKVAGKKPQAARPSARGKADIADLPADLDELVDGYLDEGEAPSGDPRLWTKAEANRRKEIEIALKHEIQRRQLEGSLLDRAEVERTQFEMARQFRDAWLGWPARIYSQMAAELGIDGGILAAVLEKHVRAHLLEQSNVFNSDAGVGGGD